MKRLLILSTLLAATSLLAACNQSTPRVSAPPAPRGSSAGCPGGLSGAECDAYKQGIATGMADKAGGQNDNFRRHAGEFDSRFEASYRAGYATGWYNNGK